MSFVPLNLQHPVSRLGEATTGILPSGMGARFVMEGGAAQGRFALVEHPIGPRTLAAPMHRHDREDEYSFILEGEWGFQLGDTVVYGKPGDLVYKPRAVWHSFWNAGDTPARLLEIVSPGGFEHYFAELAQVFAVQPSDMAERFDELNERFGLDMDFESVPGLVEAHGLAMPDMGLPAAANA